MTEEKELTKFELFVKQVDQEILSADAQIAFHLARIELLEKSKVELAEVQAKLK